jgi:hypothetical protein
MSSYYAIDDDAIWEHPSTSSQRKPPKEPKNPRTQETRNKKQEYLPGKYKRIPNVHPNPPLSLSFPNFFPSQFSLSSTKSTKSTKPN